MADPYSKTIADAIVSALDDIGDDSDDNTTTLYAARFSPYKTDENKRPSHVVRIVRKGKSILADRWVTVLTIDIDSRIPVNAISSPDSADEQLDSAMHDVHRALSTVGDSLPCHFTDIDSVANYVDDPEDPVMGFVTTTTWRYELQKTDHSFDGPGDA